MDKREPPYCYICGVVDGDKDNDSPRVVMIVAGGLHLWVCDHCWEEARKAHEDGQNPRT